MRTLDRKLWRDLWRIRGQAMAIALVIGCGVAAFVMALGNLYSLQDTRDAYYERYRFAEVFAPVKRAPDNLAARVGAIPGVKRVATRIVKDVIIDVAGMDEPATGRVVSLPDWGPPPLNDVHLSTGRLLTPGSSDEVLISEVFAAAHGLVPGDRLTALLNGRKRSLRIVGLALSPEYIYAISPGSLVPDDRHFGVLWMGRRAMAAAFDLDGAFNEATLTLLRGASEAEVLDRLDELLRPFGGIGAYARHDHLSDAYLQSELEQLANMSTIVPPIFLAVAAFLLNIVGSRLVTTERDQIGLLKAFGYRDLEVGWHYLKLLMLVTLFGIAVGFIAGAWLGRGLTDIYGDFFSFPFLHYRLHGGVFAGAALISLAATVLGIVGAVRRAVLLPPAEAMAPAPPPDYRRTALEGLGLAALAGEPTRMILRHLVRWPLRSTLTCMGMAMSAAILIGSLFFLDSIEHMIDVFFFQAQRQDVRVAFTEVRPARALRDVETLPGVLSVEPYRAVPVRLRFGHRHWREAIIGIGPGADLNRVIDVELKPLKVPPSGVALSRKVAELLGAGRGDRITVEVLEGRRPVRRLRVSAIVEEYIGTTAYMDLGALNRLMDEGPAVNGAFLLVDGRREAALYKELKETPAVAAVGSQGAALASFRETMAENLLIMVTFYALFAGLIVFGVVYNSARIGLSEHGRELASLRVLGFTRFEVSYILLGELAVLTALAVPVGCVIGFGLAWLIVGAFDTDLYRLPLVVAPATYGFAAVVVVGSALLSGLIVRRRVDRMDLVAVLKTRE